MGAGQLLTICLTVSVTIAGTGASPTPVNGARGHSVSLPPGISVPLDIAAVEWTRVSPGDKTAIVKYWKGNVTYYGSKKYKRRITLHPRTFSLEIRDLRREDSGDYEVVFTAGSGAEEKTTVRLEVYEPVSGINIKVQNNTGTCVLKLTCSVTSGEPTSLRWWRGQEAVKTDSTHHLSGHEETVEIHLTTEILDVVYKCEAKNLVSNVTKQILLKNACQLGTTEPSTTTTEKAAKTAKTTKTATTKILTTTESMLQKMTLMIGLPVLGVILIVPILVIAVIKCRRRAAGRETPSNIEDPVESDTIYANVIRRPNCHNDGQHTEQNKRDMDEHCIGTYESPPFQAPRRMY